jgi:hypothetical protein
VPVVYASSILEATTDNQHSFAGLLSSYHLLVSYNGTYVVGRSSSGSSEDDFEYPNLAPSKVNTRVGGVPMLCLCSLYLPNPVRANSVLGTRGTSAL